MKVVGTCLLSICFLVILILLILYAKDEPPVTKDSNFGMWILTICVFYEFMLVLSILRIWSRIRGIECFYGSAMALFSSVCLGLGMLIFSLKFYDDVTPLYVVAILPLHLIFGGSVLILIFLILPYLIYMGVTGKRPSLRLFLIQQCRRQPPHLTYQTITALQSMEVSNGCAICLVNFAPETNLEIMPTCGHYYHSECIQKWIGVHSTCPVCRGNIV